MFIKQIMCVCVCVSVCCLLLNELKTFQFHNARPVARRPGRPGR